MFGQGQVPPPAPAGLEESPLPSSLSHPVWVAIPGSQALSAMYHALGETPQKHNIYRTILCGHECILMKFKAITGIWVHQKKYSETGCFGCFVPVFVSHNFIHLVIC